MKSSLASVTVCALLASSAVARAQAPFPLASDPRIDPSKLRVTTFASGIPYPTGVQRLDDGSMLVAVNDPTGGRFYSSTGKLLRLTDVNHDGVADDAGTYVNTNLPGSIVQMRQAGDLLIVNSAPASGPSTINILRRGATPTSPYTNVGSLSFTWPTNQSHKTYGLAVRRSEIVGPPTYHVYFNVGSRLNAANDFATVPMTSTVAGLSNSSLQPESIYQFRLTDNGTSVSGTALAKMASGLRNAAGMAFQPGTVNLYFQDNGIDGTTDPNEPISADEINLYLPFQATSPGYGFAGDYIQYRTGTRIGSGGLQPIATFQPINGSEAEGAAEIAFAPEMFPDGLNTGLFVGFHGRFNAAGLANEENPLRYVDLTTGESFDFIGNDLPNIGHLDNIFATEDSLFVSDIATGGNMLTSGAGAMGAIYQITVIPEPAAASMIFLLAGTFAARRRR
jgi:glucose/arabinose dehydrogenase